VKVFRRRSSDAPEVDDPGQAAPGFTADDGPTGDGARARPGLTPPKGVPTPKRSEAQSNRRGPYVPPSDRKAAARQSRQRDRGDRARQQEALQRGEEWAFPPKDRGPVRALARDVVDSRRGIGEYYMVMVILLIVLLVVPGQSTKLLADAVVVVLLVVIILEGYLVGGKVKKLAAQRFPDKSTKGVMAYTMMRGIQMRRLRMPKPRVQRGDKI
jgi:Protein of unknown function (DUF3043)